MVPNDVAEGDRFKRRVRQLCAPGHRGSATEGERRAAEYLADELRAMSLEPELEPFAGLSTHAWLLILPVLAAALGLALVWATPWASIGLGLLALVTLMLEGSTRAEVLRRLLPRRPSQNVVARIAARGEVLLRVVVLAHYDTERTGWIFNDGIARRMTPLMDRSPGPLKSPLFLPQVAMLTQVVAGIFALVRPGATVVEVALVLAAVVYGVTLALLLQWAFAPYGPGAADNASGTAAALALAERWLALGDGRPEEVELVLLLTGCEEAGLLGATAWAKKHAEERPTVFLNLDTLAHGRPRFVGREHSTSGWPAYYPPEVLLVCHEAADRLDLVNAGPHSLPLPTDAMAFLTRGVAGATVLCFEEGGHFPDYHQQSDTPERVDYEVAQRGVELGWEVLRGLARR